MSQSKRYDKLLETLKLRRSIRKFQKKDICMGDVERILNAAVEAPSAGNKQNWNFLIVKSDKVKNDMKMAVEKKVGSVAAKINSQKAKSEFLAYAKYYTFFDMAPVVVCVIVKPYDSVTRRIMKLYDIESDYVSTANVQGPSAAIENLLLAASALGLGACWMTGPLIAKKELEDILGINPPDELLAIIPIGFPAENPPRRLRKKIEEVVKIIE